MARTVSALQAIQNASAFVAWRLRGGRLAVDDVESAYQKGAYEALNFMEAELTGSRSFQERQEWMQRLAMFEEALGDEPMEVTITLPPRDEDDMDWEDLVDDDDEEEVEWQD